jgi:hypothetical protein
VIGVVCHEDDRDVAREFFELFKTPWEHARAGKAYEAVIATRPLAQGEVEAKVLVEFAAPAGPASGNGVVVESGGLSLPVYGPLAAVDGEAPPLAQVAGTGEVVARGDARAVRCGYALFAEVAHLLAAGQPASRAAEPALETHIALLRTWIVERDVAILEIPPVPWGHDFIVCLTHDIDFLGIRRHRADRTLAGFLYRASVGSVVAAARRRTPWRRVLPNWLAVARLPLVHLGLAKDFWLPFDRYLRAEGELRSTFFLIPFRDRPGAGAPAARRVRYDVTEIREWAQELERRGCEVGVHGIDAWHDEERGREELARVAEAVGRSDLGVRMHWLFGDESSAARLDAAAFAYDSTCGYNDAVGFRAGTTQVFRPPAARRLLELPLHVQDTALFFPGRMGLGEREAWRRCRGVIETVERLGGVLTVLWHDRSLVPERQWGGFYERLLDDLRARRAWFGTGREVVAWFAARRAVRLEGVELDDEALRARFANPGQGDLFVRAHLPAGGGLGPRVVDVPWRREPLREPEAA